MFFLVQHVAVGGWDFKIAKHFCMNKVILLSRIILVDVCFMIRNWRPLLFDIFNVSCCYPFFGKLNEFMLNQGQGSFHVGNMSIFLTNCTEYNFAQKQLQSLSYAHIYWFLL